MRSKQLISIVLGIVIVASVAVVALAMMNNEGQSTDTANNDTTNDSQSAETENNTTGNTDEEATATDSVTIENYTFSPAAITVKVGTTVTWTNQDPVQHNVVSDNDNGPDGPLLAQGESYSFIFDKAGTYEYYCQPHPYMKGTVVVTE